MALAREKAAERQAAAMSLIERAFRPGAWNALSRPGASAVGGAGGGWESYMMRKRATQQIALRPASCAEAYFRRLASQHTLFMALCQPHPNVPGAATSGTELSIDSEQLVQCFWSSLLAQFATSAVLISGRAYVEDDLTPIELLGTSSVGALVGTGIGLLGCRIVFLWSGPAARSKALGLSGKVGYEHAPCCCSLCHCKCDVQTTALWKRAARASTGWITAISTYLGSCAISVYCLVVMPSREVFSLLAAWAVGQLLSWSIIEPAGLLVATLCVSRELRRRLFHRARIAPTPESSSVAPAVLPLTAEDRQLSTYDMFKELMASERASGDLALVSRTSASSKLRRTSSSGMRSTLGIRRSAAIEPEPASFNQALVPAIVNLPRESAGLLLTASPAPALASDSQPQRIPPKRMLPSTTKRLRPLSPHASPRGLTSPSMRAAALPSAQTSVSAQPTAASIDCRSGPRLPRSQSLSKVSPAPQRTSARPRAA